MPLIDITLNTPCGPLTFKYNVPFQFPPTIDLNIFPLPLPPKIWIPLPDCSLLKHTGSAPEPAEDSVP